jgi:hypothetical protein
MNTRFTLHHGVAFVSQAVTGLFRPAFEVTGLVLVVWLVAAGQYTAPFVWMFVALHAAGGALISLLALGLERFACRRLRWPRDLETMAIDALLEPLIFRPVVSSARLIGAVQAVWSQSRVKKSRTSAPAPDAVSSPSRAA